MAEHTPTPWDFEITENTSGWKPGSPTVTITAGDVLIATYATDYVEFPETDEENAANAYFIVKACNAYEALVKALEECQRFIDPDVGPSQLSNREAAQIIRDALSLTSADHGGAS